MIFPQLVSIVLIGQTVTASFICLWCHWRHHLFRAVCRRWGTHTCTHNSAHSSFQHSSFSRSCGKGSVERASFPFSFITALFLPHYPPFFPAFCLMPFSYHSPKPTIPFLFSVSSPWSCPTFHGPKPHNMIQRQTPRTFYKYTERSKVHMGKCDYMNELKHLQWVMSFNLVVGTLNKIYNFLLKPNRSVTSKSMSVFGRRLPDLTGRHLNVKRDSL